MNSIDRWATDPNLGVVFSYRCALICKRIPLRGDWEPDDRIAYAMASFRLAQEHLGSMHMLSEQARYSSASALGRPAIEAALRTIWFLQIASETQIAAVSRGREGSVPLLGEICSELEDRSSTFLHGRHRGLLDSMTHGNIRALAAQFLGDKELTAFNSAVLTQAGLAVGAAGHASAQALGLGGFLLEFEREFEAIP